MMTSTESVLAIIGPTASGKSDVALWLAKATDGEIVSCDSVQVYRGFEIGSAKPTAQERSVAPHHLVDVADWDEPFDAQRYRELATEAIAAIKQRGKFPIVCGGTGLYLRALRYGLVDLPQSDPEVRRQLLEEERLHPGTLYARLQTVDPDTAASTEPNNLVRVARAVEICVLAGRPASEVRREHGFRTEALPMRVVALAWSPERLRHRIAERTRRMLEAGLLGEVEQLLEAGVSPQARPMRSVGYREACEVVRGIQPETGLAERIERSTWQYGRRQRTWLRRERNVTTVEVEALEPAAERILTELRQSSS